MKSRKLISIVLTLFLVMSLAACGSSNEAPEEAPSSLWQSIPEEAAPAEEPAPEEAPAEEEAPVEEEEPVEETVTVPEGMYLSEVTNTPISESLRNQRPVAIMVDDDERALPHFGTSDADVVYELMNSTANNRVTRFMMVVKDWGAIQQFGSIRSVRPTNILLNAEWNSVLCHDGGPFYIDAYLNKGYTDHFSGTFSRINNGKATEFTEYVVSGDLDKNFNNTGVSRNYNGNKPDDETHFNFVEYGKEVTLDGASDSIAANQINMPHPHNNPYLVYNTASGNYDYYQYGEIYKDAANDRTMSFKNVIIQNCTYNVYDSNGYMIYNCIGEKQPGYYCTNGRAIPITWSKFSDTDITRFYDMDGNEIQINSGKTYITLIPSDYWEKLSIGG